MNNFLVDHLTVIIPVREGSTRIKNKIYLEIDKNISLLEWKILELKKVNSNLNIIVSSNSEKIKSISNNLGVDYHERDDNLCNGHKASFSDVITGIVRDINTEHFAWVTVVVPYMSKNMFEECFRKYYENVIKKNSYHDSLMTVNLIKDYLWNDNVPLNYKADKNHTISQNLPNIFKVTNGLYMRDKTSTLKDKYFLGSNPYKVILPKIAGIDIDDIEDYEFAKSMMKIYKKKYI